MFPKKEIKHLVNHVGIIVDASSSMYSHTSSVIKVFDNQIAYLSRKSQEMGQETRVSVYMFADKVSNLVFDMDVMRLPSLRDFYLANGNTALIDGILTPIKDLQQTPQFYGDHAFLLYVITDGEENCSAAKKGQLQSTLEALPDNWTLVVYVPNGDAVRECKNLGISPDNIDKWDTTSSRGLEEVGKNIRNSTDIYFEARSKGIRGSKSLLTLDLSHLNKVHIQNNLVEVDPSTYLILRTPAYVKGTKITIKPLVEACVSKPYRLGCAYYQLTKRETIQPQKIICIKNKKNGKVYSGSQARKLIGLPSYKIQVDPAFNDEYDIFIQSTSTNRVLMPNTEVLFFKEK